ncbi:MAG TPA: hypothetical protein VNQ79_07725 [Blastocatellia bacterium]|nr:hypothetical protein [Blastocatellia bacterium]
MNYLKLKNFAWSLVLLSTLMLSGGLTGATLVQAQDWGRDRDRWDDRRDRDRDYDRYGGYYGSRRDEEKGYRDGYDRGREDARDHRIPNPNNSSHYRKGNDAYRYGFRKGYQRGYRSRWLWN